MVGFPHTYPEGAVKVECPAIIKLNSSRFKTFSINRVLAQLRHVDLNRTLYCLELNAVERSDGSYIKKWVVLKNVIFKLHNVKKTAQRSIVINNTVRMDVSANIKKNSRST